ncbi:MAG: YhgE/Pip family protein [Leucobacter sp.]
MSNTFTRLRSKRAVSWRTIAGIILVPLTVAGVLLWGLWNPQDRMSDITAAVVNLDEPVEVDGQTVPMGRVLAGELIGSDEENFDWVLTDEDDAADGLADGNYATVITIPENFSEAATSLSDGPDEAEVATIDIDTSEQGRLIDTALSSIVTQTATNLLNQQLGEQFVGNIFVGMNELHGGISEAADGTEQLAKGGNQLADGADELADGTEQLADGTQQLSAGAGELANGQASLATGVGEYVGAASTLADSYKPLEAGAVEVVTMVKSLADLLGQVGAGVSEPFEQLESGLGAAGVGTGNLEATMSDFATQCEADPGTIAAFCDEILPALVANAGEIGGGLETAGAGAAGLGDTISGLQGAGGDLGGGGTDQLDQLINGLGAFSDGLDEFASQGTQLADGATQAAAGTSQFAAGVSDLAAGTPELADGASQLADGTRQSAEGAGELAAGLGEATSQIPNYSEPERNRMAEAAVTPVETQGESGELFNAAGVPLFAAVALWAGALAMLLVIAPLWRRTRDAARGVTWIALRSAAPVAALGAVQGAIAGIILPLVLGYNFSQTLAFLGLGLLAGVAFALIAQGLSALLGGVGRFIAFALLVVVFTVGVVSTVPAPLQALGDGSPVGAAYAGFQTIASGSMQLGGTVWALVLWALGGILLTAFAVMRKRREPRTGPPAL